MFTAGPEKPGKQKVSVRVVVVGNMEEAIHQHGGGKVKANVGYMSNLLFFSSYIGIVIFHRDVLPARLCPFNSPIPLAPTYPTYPIV